MFAQVALAEGSLPSLDALQRPFRQKGVRLWARVAKVDVEGSSPLQTHPQELARRCELHRAEQFGNQSLQRFQSVRSREKQHNEHPRPRDVLLIRKISVDGHQACVARGSHGLKQSTVAHAGPAKGRDMADLVRGKVPPQRPRNALVKQQPHGT